MIDIYAILDMIDWNMPLEIQAKGVIKAENIEDIKPFIQPLYLKYNKNVWDNCALIISKRPDEELKPYLIELLEWLQDLNWPGALCILNRIKEYKDRQALLDATNICIDKADFLNDEFWLSVLNSIQSDVC